MLADSERDRLRNRNGNRAAMFHFVYTASIRKLMPIAFFRRTGHGGFRCRGEEEVLFLYDGENKTKGVLAIHIESVKSFLANEPE